MAAEIDLLNATDRPVLLGLATPDWAAACKKTLEDLGYKVHCADSHSDFMSRFVQIQYPLLILEESFDAAPPQDNQTLKALQAMPMGQRRHVVSVLVGKSFQTLHPMQAFQQSVHAVVNAGDLGKLPQIIQKAVADHGLFYGVFRDSQLRLTQGK